MRRAATAAPLLLAALAALGGCGGGSTEVVGRSTGDPAPRAVQLELRTPDGEPLFVRDLRGRPVLLFLFATFDGMSQASLSPLGRFVRHHPEVQVVGVAVQPDPAQLLDAWAYALEPPFPVAYDPRDRIAGGTSDLGPVDQVPTYVLLDARGVEVARHVGFAGERKLDRLVEPLGPAPPQAPPPEPPPLLAE